MMIESQILSRAINRFVRCRYTRLMKQLPSSATRDYLPRNSHW
jgi:hypothetical protein